MNELISQGLDVFNSDKLMGYISEHSDILEELVPSVATAIYKMATCKAETKAMVLPHIDNVMACINITISVYDVELFLYHAFQFGLEVYDNALDLGSDVLECRNESSNVFDLIECALNTVENSSSKFQALLDRTSELVLEIENDYYRLIYNIQNCVGSSSTTVVAAWHLINSQC